MKSGNLLDFFCQTVDTDSIIISLLNTEHNFIAGLLFNAGKIFSDLSALKF